MSLIYFLDLKKPKTLLSKTLQWRAQAFESKNLGSRLGPALSLGPENTHDFVQITYFSTCVHAHKFLKEPGDNKMRIREVNTL